jgi:hypothetical protein
MFLIFPNGPWLSRPGAGDPGSLGRSGNRGGICGGQGLQQPVRPGQRGGYPAFAVCERLTPDLAELGAEVAGTAADAARRAAVAVTMATNADAVISIARDHGVLAAMAPAAVWAQMSTIGVEGADRVAAMADAERGT